MNWRTVNISAPLQDLDSQAITVAQQDSGRLTSAISRLNQIENRVKVSRPELSDSATGISSQLAESETLFSSKIDFLFISGFTYSASTKSGDYAYLSPLQIRNYIADKLEDRQDNNIPTQNRDFVLLILSASSLTRFASVLEKFNMSLAIPELISLQKATERLAKLESEKLALQNSVMEPFFSTRSANQIDITNQLRTSLFDLAELGRSYERDATSPIDELKQFIERKRQLIEDAQSTYSEIKARLSGSGAVAWSFSGSISSASRNLRNSMPENPQFSHSSGLLFSSSDGGLGFLKDVLSI